MTTQRMASFSAASTRASAAAYQSAWLNALSAPGRLSVSTRTPSASSVSSTGSSDSGVISHGECVPADGPAGQALRIVVPGRTSDRHRCRGKGPDTRDRDRHQPEQRRQHRRGPGVRVPLVVGPGTDQPAAHRRRRGCVVLGRRGQPLPRLLLAAGQPQPRPPAPPAHRRHQGPGRPALHGGALVRQRRAHRGRPAHHRARAGATSNRVFFTNGGAEANENAIRMARAAHRPPQGAGHLPQLPRRHRRGHHADRRPPPLAVASRRSPGIVHFFGPYPYRSAFHATTEAEECERALAHLGRGDHGARAPDTIAAIVLESVVGTNGVLVPPDGYLAGVRELCDRHGIVLIARRGDGRLRPRGRVVRGRPLGRHAGPHLLRQGRELRLRAARLASSSPTTSPTRSTSAPFPGGLTYCGHPLACAAAVASIRIFEEEGIVEHARPPRRRT